MVYLPSESLISKVLFEVISWPAAFFWQLDYGAAVGGGIGTATWPSHPPGTPDAVDHDITINILLLDMYNSDAFSGRFAQELLTWGLAALACSWPELMVADAGEGGASVDQGQDSQHVTRAVVLGDPQLTDRTSYQSLSSGPLLMVLKPACAALLPLG